MRKILLVLLLLASIPFGKQLKLLPNTPIHIEPPTTNHVQSPVAFSLAMRDIAKDFYLRLGKPPIIVGEDSGSNLGVGYRDVNGFRVVIGSLEKIVKRGYVDKVSLRRDVLYGEEMNYCEVVNDDEGSTLLCAGSDFLGSIYAVYAFSHEVLGVNPQHFWIDMPPIYASNSYISVDTDFIYNPGPPTVKIRGWFVNDEDQSGMFWKDPIGDALFSMDGWNKVYEYALRMRANTVIPGTSYYPDENHLELGHRRGLYLGSHHFNLLMENTFNWPVGFPYSYDINSVLQEHVWKACVNAQKDRQTLYTLGYRGLNDYPFWFDEPWFNTSESRGKLISDAIQTQKNIIEETTSGKQLYYTYLWGPMYEIYIRGYLKLPKNVVIVHTDAGAGYINGTVAKNGDGFYYHVMMEDFSANQLTEMVPPSRMFQQLEPFIKKGATSYAMINLSDMRPVPLSISIMYDFLWNPSSYLADSPDVAQRKAIEKWVRRSYQVDTVLLDDIVKLFIDYYNIDIIANHGLGEQFLTARIRTLTQNIQSHLLNGSPIDVDLANKYFKLIETSMDQSNELYAKCRAVTNLLPMNRRSFWKSHMLFQSKFFYHGTIALRKITQVMLNFTGGSSDISELNIVKSEIEGILEAERDAEQVLHWKGWYQYDQLDQVFNLHDEILCLLNLFDAHTKKQSYIRPFMGGTTKYSLQYQYNQHRYFPLNYHSNYYMDKTVAIKCSTKSMGCEDTPPGPKFTGVLEDIMMETIDKNCVIRYNMNGTIPNPKSEIYKNEIVIDQQKTITAACFIDNVIVEPYTRVRVRKV
eukprot:TRINITY_DN1874_c0_g1_i1.p1 TRINITY_DN1874_c0_g1~~TRINITY_DN1874_c0_g1_i1.p1  ORF type:complete len:804 (-),score=122.61 TRINITY_DN1874_c0_g1_i1:873-3284(-)